VHATLATHWARLIEMLYAGERVLELARDELTDPNIRVIPTETPREGVGTVEAPRGTAHPSLYHRRAGHRAEANLIVGTTNNHAAICMSIKKAAQDAHRRRQRDHPGAARSGGDGLPRL
jgi:F420-non-reducing hydrogenase large subunit